VPGQISPHSCALLGHLGLSPVARERGTKQPTPCYHHHCLPRRDTRGTEKPTAHVSVTAANARAARYSPFPIASTHATPPAMAAKSKSSDAAHRDDMEIRVAPPCHAAPRTIRSPKSGCAACPLSRSAPVRSSPPTWGETLGWCQGRSTHPFRLGRMTSSPGGVCVVREAQEILDAMCGEGSTRACPTGPQLNQNPVGSSHRIG
jgi:hypothetical protein